MIFASKTTFSHYNLKILRPKVTKKILQICLRSFVNFHHGVNFSKILCEAFMLADPKSAKMTSCLIDCIFMLLGSARVKAESKILFISTPLANPIKTFFYV